MSNKSHIVQSLLNRLVIMLDMEGEKFKDDLHEMQERCARVHAASETFRREVFIKRYPSQTPPVYGMPEILTTTDALHFLGKSYDHIKSYIRELAELGSKYPMENLQLSHAQLARKAFDKLQRMDEHEFI